MGWGKPMEIILLGFLLVFDILRMRAMIIEF